MLLLWRSFCRTSLAERVSNPVETKMNPNYTKDSVRCSRYILSFIKFSYSVLYSRILSQINVDVRAYALWR